MMPKTKGIFFPYKVNNGYTNMGLDESILNFAIANDWKIPVLRFYGWSPACVSLGRNQDDSCIDREYCKQNNIDIVRRLTGGRALLHDDELTYSFICPVSFLDKGETVLLSYKEISGALAQGFKELGIDVDFPQQKKVYTKHEYCMSLSTGADLSYNDKKIVGSAQFRKQGYILQHGSILFDYDKAKIKSIFQEEPDSAHIVTIKELFTNLSRYDFCSAIKTGVEKFFNIEFETIQSQDQSEEFLLRQGKYV